MENSQAVQDYKDRKIKGRNRPSFVEKILNGVLVMESNFCFLK